MPKGRRRAKNQASAEVEDASSGEESVSSGSQFEGVGTGGAGGEGAAEAGVAAAFETALTGSSGAGRGAALAALCVWFARRPLTSIARAHREAALHVLRRALSPAPVQRAPHLNEQLHAARLPPLFVLHLEDEDECLEWAASAWGLLEGCAGATSVPVGARAAALVSLGALSALCPPPPHLTRSALTLAERIFSAAYLKGDGTTRRCTDEQGEVIAAALECWGVVIQSVEADVACGLIAWRMAEPLQCEAGAVRVACARALAALHAHVAPRPPALRLARLALPPLRTLTSHTHAARRTRRTQRHLARKVIAYLVAQHTHALDEEGTPHAESDSEEDDADRDPDRDSDTDSDSDSDTDVHQLQNEQVVVSGWGERLSWGVVLCAVGGGVHALAPHSPALRHALRLPAEPPPPAAHAPTLAQRANDKMHKGAAEAGVAAAFETALTGSSGAGRGAALAALCVWFARRPLTSIARAHREAALHVLRRALSPAPVQRAPHLNEQLHAARLPPLFVLHLEDEDECLEWAASAWGLLEGCAGATSVPVGARAAALVSLGALSALCPPPPHLTRSALTLAERIFSAAYLKGDGTTRRCTDEQGEVIAAALECWGVVIQSVEADVACGLIAWRMAEPLQCEAGAVRVACARALAALHAHVAPRPPALRLARLALPPLRTLTSHTHAARRTRRTQRHLARKVIAYLVAQHTHALDEEGTPHAESDSEEDDADRDPDRDSDTDSDSDSDTDVHQLQNEQVVVSGWGERLSWGVVLCAVGGGVHALAPHSPALRHALRLPAEPPPPAAHAPTLAQRANDKMHKRLAQGEAARIRRVGRAKRRDKRQAHTLQLYQHDD